VKPFIDNLMKRYSEIKFVFCNINNCNGTCKEVMEYYDVSLVPTVIVVGKNGTTTLTGTIEIRNNLEGVLNES